MSSCKISIEFLENIFPKSWFTWWKKNRLYQFVRKIGLKRLCFRAMFHKESKKSECDINQNNNKRLKFHNLID